MKVGLLQLAGRPTRAESIRAAEDAIAQACAKSAQLVVLPEMFADIWFPNDQDSAHFRKAETVDDQVVSSMKRCAVENKVWVVASFYEIDDADRLFNCSVLLDPEGQVALKYRKTHIPQEPRWNEKYYFTPGDSGWPVTDCLGFRAGLQICWDNMFPEGARSMALAGANLVLAPSACGEGSGYKWRAIIQGNAAANNMYIVRVNRAAPDAGNAFYGDSFIADPDGQIIAACGEGEEILVADIDLDRVGASRDFWPFMRDRRPNAYGRICGRE